MDNERAISAINAAARARDLSYGQFVSRASKDEIRAAIRAFRPVGKREETQVESPPKEKHGRTGRPRGGRESSMTEAEYREKVNHQKNSRAQGDPQRQAEMQRLKDFRAAARLTQRGLGMILGVSGGTVSAWEAGIAGARWDLLEKIGCRRPVVNQNAGK